MSGEGTVESAGRVVAGPVTAGTRGMLPPRGAGRVAERCGAAYDSAARWRLVRLDEMVLLRTKL